MNNSNMFRQDENVMTSTRSGNKKKSKPTKYIIIAVAVLIVLIVVLSKLGVVGRNNQVQNKLLSTYTVGTRSITQILTGTGTIEPNDQYTISALVNGEIIGDYFEEGDTVIEDQLLFEIDSDSLDSGVTRAKNSLKNAQKALEDALENQQKLNVETNVTGTVKKIYVEVGDEINPGALIADIVDNETMCADIPFLDVDTTNISIGDKATVIFDTYEEAVGTVTEINPVTYINNLGVSVRDITISVKNTGSITASTKAYSQIGDAYCTSSASFYNNDEGQVYAKIGGEVSKINFKEGQRIFDGQTIVILESDDLEDSIDKLRDTVSEAEDSLEDANDAFDNYNIEAPITGKVISKSYKTGDTISNGMGSSNTMAVIYDMSALKFSMNIDELDIDKLDEGQDVIITCDSREGEEYHGTISNISIQGSTSNGTTVYPVEVVIENIEDLEKRTVDEDGTVNKVYKTGMTSSEKTYRLISTEYANGTTEYYYSDDIKIIKNNDGYLYHGDKQLKSYLNGTYTQGSSFYKFEDDFSGVTVEIQNDKKMLRPGMNIDAQIIVENRENIIAVPLAAVGRGNVVKVLKNTEEKNNDSDKTPPVNNPSESNKQNIGKNRGYGTAEPNSEYDEVRVTVGISDDDFVEITSGLNVGDVIIVDTSNLAENSQNMQFGMMGGGMSPMGGNNMMGRGNPMSGGMSAGPMGR